MIKIYKEKKKDLHIIIKSKHINKCQEMSIGWYWRRTASVFRYIKNMYEEPITSVKNEEILIWRGSSHGKFGKSLEYLQLNN